MKKIKDFEMVIIRVLVVALFALSAFGKITGFSGQAAFAASSWIPLPGEVLIAAAIVMEVVGVLLVLSGWKMREGAYILAVYTFLANIMFHIGDGEMIAFLKNMAVIGGLLAVAKLNPGKYSLKK